MFAVAERLLALLWRLPPLLSPPALSVSVSSEASRCLGLSPRAPPVGEEREGEVWEFPMTSDKLHRLRRCYRRLGSTSRIRLVGLACRRLPILRDRPEGVTGEGVPRGRMSVREKPSGQHSCRRLGACLPPAPLHGRPLIAVHQTGPWARQRPPRVRDRSEHAAGAGERGWGAETAPCWGMGAVSSSVSIQGSGTRGECRAVPSSHAPRPAMTRPESRALSAYAEH